jgi:peptidylprolyl isomerase
MVIKGFDDGVTGMIVGEKKTINIPFLEAYGPRNPEMVIDMPKDRFPQDMELEIGMPLVMTDGQGQQFQVTIVEIKDDVVVLDANHPLAGKDLVFDLELVEIVGGSPLIIVP